MPFIKCKFHTPGQITTWTDTLDKEVRLVLTQDWPDWITLQALLILEAIQRKTSQYMRPKMKNIKYKIQLTFDIKMLFEHHFCIQHSKFYYLTTYLLSPRRLCQEHRVEAWSQTFNVQKGKKLAFSQVWSMIYVFQHVCYKI